MLEEERGRSSFDKKELSYAIYKTKENFELVLKMQQKITKDPILKFDPIHIHASRQQTMKIYAKKLIRFTQLFNQVHDYHFYKTMFFSEQTPLSLHFYMFIQTLHNLCDEEQVKLFLEPANRGQILGCYAQTQLGHGSDIQNLMTTATYEQQTESFIINTPSIEATKWWIGDLGVFANHAVIFAQLIVKNKKLGLHSFLVPIRDKNHKPLPNVEVGDIGPKYGYNAKDNGYVIFKNHKIPRKNMLMKYAVVTKDGEYFRKGDEKISYATMLLIRSTIPLICYLSLTKGVLIATRYSLVRKQFKDDEGNEIPILDYQLQQQKIIPNIAEAFAITFGSQKLNSLANEVYLQCKQKGNFDRLNESHAISSGLKAVFTNDTIRALQILRRSAGGHGFSMYSGLPGLLIETSPTVTFEGENSILFLQVARFVLKGFKYIKKGKRLPGTLMHLHQLFQRDFVADFDSPEQIFNLQNLRKIFLHQSCYRAQRVSEKMINLISENIDPRVAWNQRAGITLVQCGVAYTYYWIFQNFLTSVYERTSNERVRVVLFKLLTLYAIDKILQNSQSFFQTGVITSKTIKNLNIARQILLKELRPQALNLVQAFGYDDNTVHSAIGQSHGKAYETLLDWSKNHNIINKPEVRKELNQKMIEAKQKIKPKL